MKISVITVSYNSAQTIADTLRSVATQGHRDVEHIVVDGASKDATLDIVRREGAHVATVISEPDHGIYDAMNKGLQLATGEMVGFLNADDVFAHSDVLKRISLAVDGPSVDMVYGDMVYVASDDLRRVIRHWSSGVFSHSRLRFGWMPPHPTFYARRAQIQAQGPFDTTLSVAADYDFMLRHLVRPGAQAKYLPEVLVRMRMGGASNRSLQEILRKSREDLLVMRRHEVGGVATLLCKNVRKLPQFLGSSAA